MFEANVGFSLVQAFSLANLADFSNFVSSGERFGKDLEKPFFLTRGERA